MSRNEISLFDLFSIVRRHGLLFVFSAVAMFLLVAAATYVMPRKYRSEAQLQLKLGKENLGIDPTTGLASRASISIAQSPDQEINTIANVLKSRHLAAMVVADVGPEKILSAGKDGFLDSVFKENRALAKGLNPYHTLSDEDKAIWTVQDKIKIRPIKESNSVKIHCDSKDPEQAHLIVEAFVKNYKKEHKRIHIDDRAAKVLVEAADKCLKDLKQKQDELVKFREKTGLVSIDQQRSALVNRISYTKTQLINAEAEFKGMIGAISALKTSLKDIDSVVIKEKTAGTGTVATSRMRSQLFELEMREKQLLQQFDESHYQVKNIREQIKDVKQILESEENKRTEVVQGPSSVYMATNAKLIEKSSDQIGTGDRIKQLKSSIAALNAELLELNQNEVKIERMRSEIFVLKSNYEKFRLEADKSTRLDDASTSISNIRVVPPTINPFPVFPIIPLNLAVGMILAGLTGLACAYWGELRHVRKKRAGQPEQSTTPREPGRNGLPMANVEDELEESEQDSSSSVARIPR